MSIVTQRADLDWVAPDDRWHPPTRRDDRPAPREAHRRSAPVTSAVTPISAPGLGDRVLCKWSAEPAPASRTMCPSCRRKLRANDDSACDAPAREMRAALAAVLATMEGTSAFNRAAATGAGTESAALLIRTRAVERRLAMLIHVRAADGRAANAMVAARLVAHRAEPSCDFIDEALAAVRSPAS